MFRLRVKVRITLGIKNTKFGYALMVLMDMPVYDSSHFGSLICMSSSKKA